MATVLNAGVNAGRRTSGRNFYDNIAKAASFALNPEKTTEKSDGLGLL
jgi:hypothetical protein